MGGVAAKVEGAWYVYIPMSIAVLFWTAMSLREYRRQRALGIGLGRNARLLRNTIILNIISALGLLAYGVLVLLAGPGY